MKSLTMMADAPRIFDDDFVNANSLIGVAPAYNPAAAAANPAAAPASAALEKDVTAPVTSFSGADIDPHFFATPLPGNGEALQEELLPRSAISNPAAAPANPAAAPASAALEKDVTAPVTSFSGADIDPHFFATPLPGNGEALQELLQPVFPGVEALQEQPAFPGVESSAANPAVDSTALCGSAANPISTEAEASPRRCVMVPQPGGGPLHDKIGPSTYAGGIIPGVAQLPTHVAVASTINSMLGIPGGEAVARAATFASGH